MPSQLRGGSLLADMPCPAIYGPGLLPNYLSLLPARVGFFLLPCYGFGKLFNHKSVRMPGRTKKQNHATMRMNAAKSS